MTVKTLKIDFNTLSVGEIDFIEDTLNDKCRSLLGDKVVSFSDVVEQFQEDTKPRITIPQGKIMRTLAWLQLRKDDPDATWEQAGELQLVADIVPKAEPTPPPAPPPLPPSTNDA